MTRPASHIVYHRAFAVGKPGKRGVGCRPAWGQGTKDNMAEIPKMPQPSDFGITDKDWGLYRCENDRLPGVANSKIAAYNRALEAWTEVSKAIAARADKKIDINRG